MMMHDRWHNNLVWSLVIGLAPVTRTPASTGPGERRLEDILAETWSITNPLTWSKEVISTINLRGNC